MANSDKNILITPNRGEVAEPLAGFTGQGNDPIVVRVLDGVPGALSFEGSAGQLFSITNNLTSGSIFSVNDVSGIPSLNVDANGTVSIAAFGGNVGVGVTNPGQKLDVSGSIRASAEFISSQTNSGQGYTSQHSVNAPFYNTFSQTGSQYQAIVKGRCAGSTTTEIISFGNLHSTNGTQQIAFHKIRSDGTNSQAFIISGSGGTIWNSGNDGGGSGLDADLLDGLNSATANTASTIVARDASGNFSAGTITANLTGTASNVTTNANLTGHITSVGNATVLGSFTSANLATALSDETGTGVNVFATSPTLVTPLLGTPTSGNLANCTFPTLNQNTTGNAATSSSVVNTVAGTGSIELVRGNMADNDQFRILVGGTASNAGFAEIATADDGTEPIHVRQYTGVFATLVRTATLLDGSGNTSFPGTVQGTRLISTVTTGTAPLTVSSTTVVTNLNADLLDGYNSDVNASGSTIMLRDGSGHANVVHLFSSYLNMSHTEAARTGDTVFYSSYDNFIRKNNAAGMRASLNVPTRTGGDASGTWGISITGNSATTSGPTFSGDSSVKDNITTRTDSGFWESSTGTLAEGWPTNSGGWHHLLSSTHSNNSNYYAMQISSRFDTQNLYFRNTGGSGTTAWNTIWHNNNDGAGSGLDADLLDGLNSATANTASTIVARDGSGNFSAGTITAALTGNASTATNLSNAGTVTLATATESNSIYITQPSYITDQPVKLLNFDWYGNPWSLGNIRGGGVDSFGFGIFSAGTERARFTTSGLTVTGTGTATGDFRAPIFYDSNNTAYYTDPASTSNLNGLTVASTITGTARDSNLLNSLGSYVWSASTLPTSFGLGITNSFVQGSDGWQSYGSVMNMRTYSGGGGSLQLFVPYSPSYGGTALQVRFGNYDVTSGNSWTSWKTLFASDYAPFDGLTSKTSGTGTYTTSGDFRAPIFYDSNNTAFYTDPASTSNLNVLLAQDFKTIFVSGAGGHSFATNHYSMGKDIANSGWSPPHYSDLIIGYHTGIRLGAHYSGIRFYNNSPTTDANNDGNGDGGEALLMTVGGYVGTANHTDVVVNNNLFANASMRSPIFYDSGNTAYYTDPASTSNLNVLNLSGRLGIDNPADYASTVITGLTSAPIDSYAQYDPNAGSSATYYPMIHQTALYVAGYRTHTSYGLYKAASEFSGAHYFAIGGSDSSPTESFFLNYGGSISHTNGYVITNGSSRAPIFYDSNNTGYYIDPASTSNLNGLTVNSTFTVNNGWSYVANNYGYGIVGLYSPSIFQLVFAMGDAYKTTAAGGINNLYGIAWSHPNAGGIAANLNTHGALITENGVFLAALSGSIRCRDDMRAPLYYDSNNTAYYTDPASTSNLNGLTVAGTITGSVSGNSGNSGTVGGLSVHAGRNNEANKVVRTDGSGYIQAGWINSDSGDSGFATRLTRITCSNDNYLRFLPLTDFKVSMGESAKNNYSRRVDFTSDANYHVGSFGHSGYGANETFHGGSGFWDIWSGTNYPGGLTHIHGFNALHYTTSSLGTTGGVAYGWQMAAQYDTNNGPWWRRCSAGSFSSWLRLVSYGNNLSGDIYAERYYDHNNTAYYTDPASNSFVNTLQTAGALTVGNSTSSDIFMTDTDEGTRRIHCNSNRIGFLNDGNGWGAYCSDNGDWTTDFISYAGASHRAPIFYDSNDTGYYLDPNSTSDSALRIRGGALHGPNPTWGAYLLVGGDGRQNYIDNTTTASVCATNGNLHIDAASEKGTYLNLYDGTDVYFGNGANSIVGSVNSSGHASFPIYYDYSNTAFYTDPASTSILNALTLGGRSTTNAMYYQGFTLDANTMDTNATGFTYSVNAPATGPIARFSTGGGYDLWLNAAYHAGGNQLYFRTRNGDSGTINSWKALASYGINYSDSLYASIFYDSNNTAYYINPDIGSNLNTVNATRFSAPNSGLLSVGDNSATYTYNDGSSRSRVYISSLYPVLTLNSTALNGNVNHGPTIQFSHNGYDTARQWVIGTPGSGSCLDIGTGQSTNYNPHIGISGYEGTTLMRFTTSGNIGLGGNWGAFGANGNPSHPLHVIGTGLASGDFRAPIFYDSNNTGYYIDPASTSDLNSVNMQGGNVYGTMLFRSDLGATSGALFAPPLQAYSTGNNSAFMSFHKGGHFAVNFGLDSDNVLRIGGWSASANRWVLDMSGNMTAAGNVTAYSDIRLKDNIEVIDNALWKVLQINGVTFTRNDQEDKEKRHVGVIAQEVEKVLPEVVSEDNQGIKNVAYGNMVGLLIEAIKEQQIQINDLKDQQKMIEDLRKEVDNLKKSV